jgi:hypothetical protein
MKDTRETFVSIDIETDGPIPGEYSMLSFAAVAFDEDANVISSFEANLLPTGAKQDERTMTEFWAKNPEAWDYCTKNQQDPAVAMPAFVAWVESLPGVKTAVCAPAGFDWTFTYWYMIKYHGRSPFSYSCLDVKTYVYAIRKGLKFKESAKGRWPKRWFTSLPHTHKAIDDALEQGYSFMRMRAEHLFGIDALAKIEAKPLSKPDGEV